MTHPAAMGRLSLSALQSDEGPGELRAVLWWEVRLSKEQPMLLQWAHSSSPVI